MRTVDDTQPFTLTVSIGIGELEQGENIESLLRRADAALYRAKGMGRNRCELAGDVRDHRTAARKLRQTPQADS
jgi:diguanylate cyclase (GGDEF)-like protein